MRYVDSRKRPRSGGIVARTVEEVLERRHLGARRVAALDGWSSCCGSPSSTRLVAAPRTATTLASDIWPASSTNSTSTASAIFGDAQSHDVPATTVAAPVVEADADVVGVLAAVDGGIGRRPLLMPRLADPELGPRRRRRRRLAAAFWTSSSRLPITLWLLP